MGTVVRSVSTAEAADPRHGGGQRHGRHLGLWRGVFAALTHDLWRSLPPQLVARRVVAAADRQDLVELLQEVPGAVVGPWEAHRSRPTRTIRAWSTWCSSSGRSPGPSSACRSCVATWLRSCTTPPDHRPASAAARCPDLEPDDLSRTQRDGMGSPRSRQLLDEVQTHSALAGRIRRLDLRERAAVVVEDLDPE